MSSSNHDRKMAEQREADFLFTHRLPPPSVVNSGSVDGGPSFRHSNTYDLNSKIMLTVIISLSFVVVGVIILHIYARCVLRRRARQSAIIRRLGQVNAATEPPKTGLDPAIIASLPSFVINITNGDDEEDNNDKECAVCLSVFEDQEMARFLPNCKHTFHAECIDKWLTSRSTCPICRAEAEPRVQPEPREGPVQAGGAVTGQPLEMVCVEGTSDVGNINQCCGNNKASGSMSRLSSFRRILGRERSSRTLQSEIQEIGVEDLERQ